MRVLTVIQHFYPALAGAEKFGQALAESMVRRGYPQIVLTARWERDWKPQETLNGLSIIRHPIWWLGSRTSRRFAGISYMIFLFVYLVRLRSKYDVMLIHQAQKGAFVASLAGRFLGKPTVVVVHCAGRFGDIQVMRSNQFGFYTPYMIESIKRSTAFVAICSDIVTELRSEGFERISMIHDGIVPWETSKQREYSRGERLLTLARLHPQKGLDILIRALALLKTSRTWTLDICGEGPEHQRLEQLANDVGVADRITFKGLVCRVDRVLETADIFVLPSRGEGMGIALLEAMYAGLPSIVTRVSGFVDIVTHDVNGCLVDPEDPQALADAIDEMRLDAQRRWRLGEAGRVTVLERFTLEATADKYIQLLESLTTPSSMDGRRSA